ncbi:heparan sulfate 2-O-sulfotransferase 1-like isoform X2 [Corticium candelabrum]|uniref:heparan sulfate 2-O-sulfotransferase 1-like isoform X2 n=1 Tax=Corticium candelabrum TaxID=121492 RepID=UPI002E262AF8|nr:heparan sulfate 2-O-sulfotransferase 1-like isoform X2 [Corticium candelabrum]
MRSQNYLLLVAGTIVLLLEIQIWLVKVSNDEFKAVKAASVAKTTGVEKRSLAIGNDEDLVQQGDHTLVLYNRVPKTGSTTFMWVVYKLCSNLHYNVLHLNITNNDLIMAPSDQYDFVQNITRWRDKLPGLYHGHVAYIDFLRFGFSQPLYIQIIREPLERLVSHYYFLRYGDNFRSHLIRSKMGDKTTFDECVQQKLYACKPERIWLQVGLFCGHEPQCWKPGNEWALMTAKHNLVSNYLLVGFTDQIPEFIAVLEAMIPRFFRGASKLYAEAGAKSHLRRTVKKDNMSDETVTIMKSSRVYRMEKDFYDFARVVFNDVKRRTVPFKQEASFHKRYHYEKIKP